MSSTIQLSYHVELKIHLQGDDNHFELFKGHHILDRMQYLLIINTSSELITQLHK